jgi:hypothetical protein
MIRWATFALAAVACASNLNDCRAQTSFPLDSQPALEAKQRILRALDEPVSLRAVDEPIEDVVARLQNGRHISIQLDLRGIQEVGGSADMPLTADLSGIRLRSALDLLLSQHELNWIINDDVLLITSDTKAMQHVETRVYPVVDLVLTRFEDGIDQDYDSLIELITSTIQPTAWASAGGSGEIAPFANSGVIVVSQSRMIQDQIELLLKNLRSARDHQGVPKVETSTAGYSDSDQVDPAEHPVHGAPDGGPRRPQSTWRTASPQPAWRVPCVYK